MFSIRLKLSYYRFNMIYYTTYTIYGQFQLLRRSFQELWWEKSEFGTILIQKCQKCKNLRSKFQLLRTSFQELWWQKTWFGHFCKKISWVLLRKMCQNYFSRFFPWVHQKNRVVEKCEKITDFAIFPLGTSKKSGRSENLWQKLQPFCDFWDLVEKWGLYFSIVYN